MDGYNAPPDAAAAADYNMDNKNKAMVVTGQPGEILIFSNPGMVREIDKYW